MKSKNYSSKYETAKSEHLNEYRKVTQRSLELQQLAVTRQEQFGKLYRHVMIAGSILVVFIIALIIYLMVKLR